MSNEKNVEKTKIYTDQKHRFGATITMPYVGDVEFDHEGKAEVDSQHVHKLIADVDTVFLADNMKNLPKDGQLVVVSFTGPIKPSKGEVGFFDVPAIFKDGKFFKKEDNSIIKKITSWIPIEKEDEVTQPDIFSIKTIDDEIPELNADVEENLSVDSINKLNLQELQDLATAAGLPEKDWKYLKKQKLINFLKDNMGGDA